MGRGFEEVRERDMWLRRGHVQLMGDEGRRECRAEGAISGRTEAHVLAGPLVLADAMSQSSSDRRTGKCRRAWRNRPTSRARSRRSLFNNTVAAMSPAPKTLRGPPSALRPPGDAPALFGCAVSLQSAARRSRRNAASGSGAAPRCLSRRMRTGYAPRFFSCHAPPPRLLRGPLSSL